jgi:hypothetical protein
MANSDSQPIPFSPSLPDITKKQPYKVYSADPYMLLLVEDVLPIGGGDFFRYPLVIAVFGKRIGAPVVAYPVVPGRSKYGILTWISRREGGYDGIADGQGAIAHTIPRSVSRRGELRGILVRTALAGRLRLSWVR